MEIKLANRAGTTVFALLTAGQARESTRAVTRAAGPVPARSDESSAAPEREPESAPDPEPEPVVVAGAPHSERHRARNRRAGVVGAAEEALEGPYDAAPTGKRALVSCVDPVRPEAPRRASSQRPHTTTDVPSHRPRVATSTARSTDIGVSGALHRRSPCSLKTWAITIGSAAICRINELRMSGLALASARGSTNGVACRAPASAAGRIKRSDFAQRRATDA